MVPKMDWTYLEIDWFGDEKCQALEFDEALVHFNFSVHELRNRTLSEMAVEEKLCGWC